MILNNIFNLIQISEVFNPLGLIGSGILKTGELGAKGILKAVTHPQQTLTVGALGYGGVKATQALDDAHQQRLANVPLPIAKPAYDIKNPPSNLVSLLNPWKTDNSGHVLGTHFSPAEYNDRLIGKYGEQTGIKKILWAAGIGRTA